MKPHHESYPELPAKRATVIRNLLTDKKVRDAERAFVLEGRKPILELLRGHGAALLEVVAARTLLDDPEPEIARTLARAGVPVYQCRDRTFEQLSAVTTAQGLLAVVRKTDWDEEAILGRPRLFGVLGEGLQDPTNVGAIVRTALALGLDGLWLTADSADVYNPKVVRATAGAVLRLPVFLVKAVQDVLDRFAEYGCAVLAADSSQQRGRTIGEITARPPRAVLALGNESRGLSGAVLGRAALRFHIPVSRQVESLNVAAAAAIALFHFSRLPVAEH